MKNSLRLAYQDVKYNKKILLLLLVFFVLTAFYPSDSGYYKAREESNSSYVYFVEDGLRYSNTVLQAMVPILLADKIGIIQAAYVGLGTFVSVYTFKRLLNNVYINGTRIGQRPKGGNYNTPSGHSAMATSAMTFIMVRYRVRWLTTLFLLTVSILTMFVRVLLKAHTVSGVCSGAILGIMVALLLTSHYNNKVKFSNILGYFGKKNKKMM